MCRTGKFSTEAAYGNNILCCGDLLSTDNPAASATSGHSPKFRRKPMVNCYLGNANFLNMKIEKDFPTGSWYSPNPFPIVELQPDVTRVCDLLNLMYPINLATNNRSNFIFIPVTWANNLFKSWTKDPGCAVADTIGSPSTTMGQLSRPSKTTTNRKKALILVVNKPDWFEPMELTYLGFDNDYSEIPMAESDKIDFSINYADTTRKFADGTAYNGTISGPKKIITYTTPSTGKGRLTFPQKGLLKVVVDVGAGGGNLAVWEDKGKAGLTAIYANNWNYFGKTGYANGKWLAVNNSGYVAHSTDDGKTWVNQGRTGTGDNGLYNICTSEWFRGATYVNSKWLTVNYYGYVATSTDDGKTWTNPAGTGVKALASIYANYWHGGATYANGKWLAVNRYGYVATSTDDGRTWTNPAGAGVKPLASI
jgi:hypothetical protein